MPFVVTNRGYGLIWDNPSKTTIEPGFNEQTKWTSEVGDRVSFFVIAGNTTDEIYAGYRLLTGATPMLPKAAYGYIQCKQRYSSQDEVLAVAKGYRDRGLPADVMVVDWFYWTKMGQIDMDPVKWPDPAAMNRQLHEMGFQTMISVWPRFMPGSRYYDFLLKKGWFEQLADGTPTNGLPYDRAGSDIDTTNPEAARWYWETIRDNILSKGFDAIWADETEPDLPPNGSYFHIGPGTRYFNIYPLFHTAALYDGFRRDIEHRALILSRDAYLGAQRNGDHVLVVGYLSDLGHAEAPDSHRAGFYRIGHRLLEQRHRRLAVSARRAPSRASAAARSHRTRATTSAATTIIRSYTRAGSSTPPFCPSSARTAAAFTTRSGRTARQAEPILEKYLKLRYRADAVHLLAWLLAHYESGAPYMRALFMDFPDDPQRGRSSRRIHVRPGVSGGSGDRPGRHQPDGVSAGRRGLVQLLDQRARARRADDQGGLRPSTRCRCSCAPVPSCRLANRC